MFFPLIVKSTFVFFLTFLLFNNLTNASSDVGIFYKPNHHPKSGGKNSTRIMNFVGKQSQYKLESNLFAQKAYSVATCDLKKSKKTGKMYHSSPCSTSVVRNLESFTLYCTKDSKNDYAIITFYPINKNVEGFNEKGWTASVYTFGDIYAGFSTDPRGKKLRKSKDSKTPLITKGKHPDVILNCNGQNRK